MNPSTSGWIKKYFEKHDSFNIFQSNDYEQVSQSIRTIGFSFGAIDINELPPAFKNFKYTQEELAKVCYLQLLEKVYYIKYPESNHDDFIAKLISFYQLLIPHKDNIFTSFFSDKNPYSQLESIFTLRMKDHFFSQSKNNDFVLNMILLSIDILAFEAFVNKDSNPNIYSSYMAESLTTIITLFKEQKDTRNDADNKLIDFLQKTMNTATIEERQKYPSPLEVNFISDFVICNSWNNDTKELIIPSYIRELYISFTDKEEELEESKSCFLEFVAKRNNDYYYLRSSNLFDNVVENSSSYIRTLLIRNKDRIVKEFQKNTQLTKLVMDSTHRDLSTEEKKMVKKQTIEIIKTIPSLAIFLLPGGTILLPIILKFIPSLLPSSFNENLDDN